MRLIFVFMLASGSISSQPQSEENCAKLTAAFEKGERVAAIIKGNEVPIVRGECIPIDQASKLEMLRSTIQVVPAS